MKKIMKYMFIGALAGTTLTSVTSCTDLDEKLYDKLNDTNIDLTNKNDLSLILGASVAQYRYLVEDWFGMFHLLEESTDQYVVPKRIAVGWGDAYVNLHKHNWGTDVGQFQNPWDIAYRGIAYANMVLDNTKEDDVEALCQARFFRAMFYYHLLDMFGNAPLQTTQNVPDGYLPEQVGVEKLFDFCVTEFQYVKENIGDSNTFGWANKYAAEMALAKLYLNKNVYLGTTGSDGYEAALAEVEDIIKSGKYSLAANYKDNFKENINDCSEVIFAIPGDRTHTAQFGLQSYCFPQTGLEAYGSTAPGYNGSTAIPQWIRTYDADDQRLNDTWAYGEQHYAVKNADGTYTPNAGDPIPFSDDDWSGTGYLNYNINVHSVDAPGAFQQEGARLHKYEIVAGNNKGTTPDDFPIFRYADALMIKAECLLRLGRDKDTAAELVTEVRKRSFPNAVAKATRTVAQLEGPSVYAYGHEEYNGTPDADGNVKCTDWSGFKSTNEGGSDIELGGLLDDLGWEFCAELHRRQDLRRFKLKDGRNVWNGKSWFCKDATSDTTYDVFAIPSSAMKTNSKLKQNPGYPEK